MPEWLQNLILTWLGPAGVVAIIGFVIWLVQHNILLIQHNKKLSEHDTALRTIDKDHQSIVLALERVSITLDHVSEIARKAEDHVEEYHAEADAWKHRIVALEAKVENNHG